MPPARKRSKHDELASLRFRIPFISQSALSSILKIAATEGLPAITTRRGVREARDKFVGITTPHGPLHTHINVDSVTIEVQNPFAVFWYACKTTGRGGKTPGINQRLLRGSYCYTYIDTLCRIYECHYFPGAEHPSGARGRFAKKTRFHMIMNIATTATTITIASILRPTW